VVTGIKRGSLEHREHNATAINNFNISVDLNLSINYVNDITTGFIYRTDV